MRRRALLRAATGLGAFAFGCSSEGEEPTTVTADGEMGMLTFVITSEGPIQIGVHDLGLEVDSTEGVEAGLLVEVSLEMPSMTHGADDLAVDANGDGYEIRQAHFSMPGDWLLHVEASKDGAMLDRASFTLSVV